MRGEQRFVAVGLDALGRVLTVVYTYRHPDTIRLISARPATRQSDKPMKPEYDMTNARRATEIDHLNRLRAGKTRLTVVLDDALLDALRRAAAELGLDCQELIGLALREYLGRRPIDEDTLRRVLREELHPAA